MRTRPPVNSTHTPAGRRRYASDFAAARAARNNTRRGPYYTVTFQITRKVPPIHARR